MEFINQLVAWDKSLFLTLNSYHSNFWDGFMWIFSSKLVWVPAALSVLYVIYKDKKGEFILILAGLILTIVICDQIASSLFKPMIGRLRPSHELGDLVHLVNGYKGGQFGFMSSHAANAFGFAMFSALIFRFKPYTIAIFLWAFVNSYSGIYLGIHYPLDIICGGLTGITCALIVYLLYRYLKRNTGFVYKPVAGARATSTGIEYKHLWFIISILLLTIYFIAAFGKEMIRFIK